MVITEMLGGASTFPSCCPLHGSLVARSLLCNRSGMQAPGSVGQRRAVRGVVRWRHRSEGQGDEGSPAYGRSPACAAQPREGYQVTSGIGADQVAGSMPCFLNLSEEIFFRTKSL